MLQFIFLLFTTHISPPDKWVTFQDSLSRYTIQYPANWTQQYVENATGFMSPLESETDLFQENVNVLIQDLSAQPMSLKDFTDLSKKQYTDGYGPSAIISLKDTTFLGNTAEVGIFNISVNGTSIKLEQYWFIKNDNAFILTYTADPGQFDKYRKIAEKVMRSFKLSQQKGG